MNFERELDFEAALIQKLYTDGGWEPEVLRYLAILTAFTAFDTSVPWIPVTVHCHCRASFPETIIAPVLQGMAILLCSTGL